LTEGRVRVGLNATCTFYLTDKRHVKYLPAMKVTVTGGPVKNEMLAGLRVLCKEYGITHDAIAKAAGVSRPLVVNVFAGRATSRNVLETAQRLVRTAQQRAVRNGG
jgi:hypothetical protein